MTQPSLPFPSRAALRPLAALAAVAAALALCGCTSLSGRLLHASRSEFNEMAQITNAEQLLLNIVRLRYASSPYFLEISSLSTSTTMGGALGVTVNKEASAVGLTPNVVGAPSVTFTQTPSFVYQPLTGDKLARQLLRPVDLRTLALLHTAGWDLRDVLRVLVDSINGVANARKAVDLAPGSFSENTQFQRVLAIMDSLEDKGLIQFGVSAELSADHKGDVAMSLRIEPSAAHLAEVQEFLQILSLDAGDLTFRVAAAVTGGGGNTIVIRPRSILAAMRFISKGIDVPQDDVQRGLVSVLDRSPGNTPQWDSLMKGIMHIASSDSPPDNAYVRVHYLNHWFYIANDDIYSQETFALMETAFAVQSGDSPPVATVLTLPIGR